MILGRNETIPLQRRESNFYTDLNSREPNPQISLDDIKLNIDNLTKMIAKTDAESKKQSKNTKRTLRCLTTSISFLGLVCFAMVILALLNHFEVIKKTAHLKQAKGK